jgi:hypothetical protein
MAGPSNPKTHPASNGLDAAIRDGVRTELDSRGVGGGGGGNDRLATLEREVAIIKETMVKQKDFDAEMSKVHRDASEIKLELARMPMKIVGWLVTALAALSGIIFTVYRIASNAGN